MTTNQLIKSMTRLCMKLRESVECREPYNRILRRVAGWKGKFLIATDGRLLLAVRHPNTLLDFEKDITEFLNPKSTEKPVDRAALLEFCGPPEWAKRIPRGESRERKGQTVVVLGRPVNRLLISRLLTVAPEGPIKIGRDSAMRALTFSGDEWQAVVMEVECRFRDEELIKPEWPRFENEREGARTREERGE